MSPLPLGAAAGSQTILIFGLLIFGGAALLVILAAVRRNRAATKSREISGDARARESSFRRREPPPFPVNVRLGYDGFWLESATLPADTLIYYECTFEKKVVPGRVRYAPHAKGQFVFTGDKPLGVLVTRVVLKGEQSLIDGPDIDYSPDTFSSGDLSSAAALWHLGHGQHRPEDSPAERPRADPPAY